MSKIRIPKSTERGEALRHRATCYTAVMAILAAPGSALADSSSAAVLSPSPVAARSAASKHARTERLHLSQSQEASLVHQAPQGEKEQGAAGSLRNSESDHGTADATVNIEEVVVTATRFSQPLLNVPIAATAFTQASLQQLDVTGIDDITRLTPGIEETQGNTGTTRISMRGISSTIGAATTGIYIDDTPIQVRLIGAGDAGSNAFPSVFDLQRVEVLQGPQGTLFGSESEGGTLRFITPDPAFATYSGHARAQFGYNAEGAPNTEFGAAAGGPLVTGHLGFRMSAYDEEDGGWIDEKPYPGDATAVRNANSSSTKTLSAALGWAVTDNLILTPKVFYQDQKFSNSNSYWGDLSDPSAGRFVSGALFPTASEDTFTLSSLKAEWSSDHVSVFSNTSYMNRKRDATQDYTFFINELLTGNYTGPNAPAPAYFQNPQTQFTQEVRLQSPSGDERLSWVIGGFYQNLNEGGNESVLEPGLGNLVSTLFSGATVQDVFGEGILPGGVVAKSFNSEHDTELAGYGQLDFKIVSNISVTAGFRYTVSRFRFDNAQDGPFNGGATGATGSGSEVDRTPKYGLEYKPRENLMFYASVAKGFRPGGANIPVNSDVCASDLQKLGLTSAPTTYGQDSVWDYEIGSKGDVLDHRLVWAGSVFYIDWSRPQSEVALPTCGYSFISNLGRAVSKGVQIQLSISPIRHLALEASIGYVDARYTQTVLNLNTPPRPVVSAGELLPGSPWHVMVAADYQFNQLSDRIRPYAHLDDEYTSSYHLGNPDDALYTPLLDQFGSVNVMTVRAGMRFGGWDLSVYAKNLLDSQDVLFTSQDVTTSQLITYQIVPPRTVGVTANYRF